MLREVQHIYMYFYTVSETTGHHGQNLTVSLIHFFLRCFTHVLIDSESIMNE